MVGRYAEGTRFSGYRIQSDGPRVFVGRKRGVRQRRPSGDQVRLADRRTQQMQEAIGDCAAIYVLTSGELLCKIGWSADPYIRAVGIQAANGQETRMERVFWLAKPDALNLERAIHRGLRRTSRYARGEWYYLDAEEASGIVMSVAKVMGLRLWSDAGKQRNG